MKTLLRIALVGTLLTLLSACAGTYLGGLVTVDHNVSSPYHELDDNEHPALWGECQTWRRLSITSELDVDTAYNNLMRSGIPANPYLVPETKSERVNRQINAHWSTPEERPHLLYVMPPRWMTVTLDDFSQSGVVAFSISKHNRRKQQGSYIDIEYCRGGKYEVGFYVPDHLLKKFERNLLGQFRWGLKSRPRPHVMKHSSSRVRI